MNIKKDYSLFETWFSDWSKDKTGWPQPGKTRTAAGLMLLWHKNAISTLEEIAELSDMTVNSLRVARTEKGTEKVFKVVCQKAAIDFCNYLFCECGLDELKDNETELFHTLDGLNEEAAKVFFDIVSHPNDGIDSNDNKTCDAYLNARDFLLQISWVTLSRSNNLEMNWETRRDAASTLDKSLHQLNRLLSFHKQHPSNLPPRLWWKQ